MTGERLHAAVEQYRAAAAGNVPPPPIGSDPVAGGVAPIEHLLRVLGIAANTGDAGDEAEALGEHAERDAAATAAASAFAAEDAQSAQQLAGLGADVPPDPLSQQLPQLISGMTSAAGGALQPLGQIPQQWGQALAQALQVGLGMGTGMSPALAESGLKDSAFLDGDVDPGYGVDTVETLSDDADHDWAPDTWAPDTWAPDAWTDPSHGGFDAGGAYPGPIVPGPFGALGAPPVPSPSTSPASAPGLTPAATPAPHPTPVGAGMTGMPLVPPLSGGAGTDRETRVADDATRRVAVPRVRNGAPVQGRLVVPAPELVDVVRTDGKPVSVRRVADAGR